MGRPLMEPLIWNATSDKPFGRSRIKEPVRRLIDSYVRTIANATIGLEFATAPQKYLMGVSDEQYDAIINKKFQQYIGSIIAGTTNPETGEKPTFGQLSQGSLSPHASSLSAGRNFPRVSTASVGSVVNYLTLSVNLLLTFVISSVTMEVQKKRRKHFMEKMSKTARLLDRLCRFICSCLILVAIFILLAGVFVWIIHLRTGAAWKPELLHLMHFGNLSITLDPGTLSEALRPGFEPWMPVIFLLLAATFVVYYWMGKTIRAILRPFIDRTPFQETVARNLKQLSILLIISAALGTAGSLVTDHVAQQYLDLDRIFLTAEGILSANWESTSIDAAPFILAAVLYLLSKVFQYGQELQELSDETL